MFWYQFQLFLILKNWFHFSVFFFFLSLGTAAQKVGGEKERKNILLGPSILKNCTEMVVNEGGNQTSNEEIKDI